MFNLEGIRERHVPLKTKEGRKEVPEESALCILTTWGFSSAGRAPALQAGGQRFDPANLHQTYMERQGQRDDRAAEETAATGSKGGS